MKSCMMTGCTQLLQCLQSFHELQHLFHHGRLSHFNRVYAPPHTITSLVQFRQVFINPKRCGVCPSRLLIEHRIKGLDLGIKSTTLQVNHQPSLN